ncbi:MAG: hypothetical protein EA385_12945 [Salinarimonadaceae bacterium]|nr:MAG: hypothetical protein EA385_12945 [Salinarimonadaceae bacterium]
MNDFHPSILFAIAQETLGFWLYVGLAALALVLVLYGLSLVRGRRLRGAPLRYAALVGAVAGVAAMAIAPAATQASFAHLLAAIDFILLGAIGISVFVGATFALTPVFALLGFGRSEEGRVSLTSAQ